MELILAVRNRIMELAEARHWTINRVATECGMAPSSVKNILYGKSKNPKLETIKILCDGFGITLKEFFDTPEFNALEQTIC